MDSMKAQYKRNDKIKFIFERIGKFILISYCVISLLVINFFHEIGHVVAQIVVGFPITIGFNFADIGFSTTWNSDIFVQPSQIFYPVALAGLIVSLVSAIYFRKFVWFPEELFNKKDVESLKTIWYVGMCFLISIKDLGLIIRYVFFPA